MPARQVLAARDARCGAGRPFAVGTLEILACRIQRAAQGRAAGRLLGEQPREVVIAIVGGVAVNIDIAEVAHPAIECRCGHAVDCAAALVDAPITDAHARALGAEGAAHASLGGIHAIAVVGVPVGKVLFLAGACNQPLGVAAVVVGVAAARIVFVVIRRFRAARPFRGCAGVIPGWAERFREIGLVALFVPVGQVVAVEPGVGKTGIGQLVAVLVQRGAVDQIGVVVDLVVGARFCAVGGAVAVNAVGHERPVHRAGIVEHEQDVGLHRAAEIERDLGNRQ